jgi:hypothetical protein
MRVLLFLFRGAEVILLVCTIPNLRFTHGNDGITWYCPIKITGHWILSSKTLEGSPTNIRNVASETDLWRVVWFHAERYTHPKTMSNLLPFPMIPTSQLQDNQIDCLTMQPWTGSKAFEKFEVGCRLWGTLHHKPPKKWTWYWPKKSR